MAMDASAREPEVPAQLRSAPAAAGTPLPAQLPQGQRLSGISRKILSLTPEQRANLRRAGSAPRVSAPSPLRPPDDTPDPQFGAVAPDDAAMTPSAIDSARADASFGPQVAVPAVHQMHAHASAEGWVRSAGNAMPAAAPGVTDRAGAGGGLLGLSDGRWGQGGEGAAPAEPQHSCRFTDAHAAASAGNAWGTAPATPPTLAPAGSSGWEQAGGTWDVGIAAGGVAATPPLWGGHERGGVVAGGATQVVHARTPDAAEFGGMDDCVEGDDEGRGGAAEGGNTVGRDEWGSDDGARGGVQEEWGYEEGGEEGWDEGWETHGGGGGEDAWNADEPDTHADHAYDGSEAWAAGEQQEAYHADAGHPASGAQGDHGGPHQGYADTGHAVQQAPIQGSAGGAAGGLPGPAGASAQRPLQHSGFQDPRGSGRAAHAASSFHAAHTQQAAPAARAAAEWDFDDELRRAEEEEEAERAAEEAAWAANEPDQNARPDAHGMHANGGHVHGGYAPQWQAGAGGAQLGAQASGMHAGPHAYAQQAAGGANAWRADQAAGGQAPFHACHSDERTWPQAMQSHAWGGGNTQPGAPFPGAAPSWNAHGHGGDGRGREPSLRTWGAQQAQQPQHAQHGQYGGQQMQPSDVPWAAHASHGDASMVHTNEAREVYDLGGSYDAAPRVVGEAPRAGSGSPIDLTGDGGDGASQDVWASGVNARRDFDRPTDRGAAPGATPTQARGAALPNAFDALQRASNAARQRDTAAAATAAPAVARPGGLGVGGSSRGAMGGMQELPGVAQAAIQKHDARKTCPEVYRASGLPPEGLGRAGQPWWTALRDFVPISELEVCPADTCTTPRPGTRLVRFA